MNSQIRGKNLLSDSRPDFVTAAAGGTLSSPVNYDTRLH